jgi:ABC-type sugar transport system permease subunit
VLVALVDIGIAALDFFTIVAIMTESGPNRASDLVAHYPERFS